MPLRFDSIPLLLAGLALAVLAAVIAIVRRPAVPIVGQGLIGLGLLLLAGAAGGANWRRPVAREVAVMVDLSPSTRTAAYRDRARLDQRMRQLLGGAPFHVIYFAEDARATAEGAEALTDLPAARTVFTAPVADAVLLFSDARFDLPAFAPRTYIVSDLALEAPADAAVERLEIRGDDAVITLRNNGAPRELVLSGVTGPRTMTVPTGPLVARRVVASGTSVISVQFTPGDPWPENDGLTIHVPPPRQGERWWVGAGPPAKGWRTFSPGSLPGDAAAYLAPSVIVLQNLAASELSAPQQRRLAQYVRELGGALVILGGERAFAAGGYPGSLLEDLSPLASTPPQPATHWVVLVDSSGSMGEASGPGNNAATRWETATSAVVALLPQLPPDDPVTIGSFSDAVRWWSQGKSARDTAALPLPPAGVGPHGPTNLEEALRQIAGAVDGSLPTQLLLLTDADATVNRADELAATMQGKNVRLHLLAIGEGGGGSAIPGLQKIIAATGGSFSRQPDPAKWLSSLQELMRGAMPQRLFTDAASVQFKGELAAVPSRSVQPWNRTWMKGRAAPFAESQGSGEKIVMAARWPLGTGEVLAAAFPADASEAEAMAKLVAKRPHDPRFAVTWDAGATLSVSIDAVDGAVALNGLVFSLELQPAEGGAAEPPRAIPQAGPGRYSLSIAAPRTPVFAAIRGPGGIVDRITIAGRYAVEFGGIGNYHPSMRELATRTGGEVIAPSQMTPIDFHWPPREVPLMSWLAVVGAACIAGGLGVGRMTR